ncbi:MAG: hypothetical protein CL927_13695 [Deltaproteobacteria bacterium]|nr:hypothetical protein [Deltaproteobacteria bacterium]HCH66521.1 hypothetical protein [Deltaproteobacteria bacterium]
MSGIEPWMNGLSFPALQSVRKDSVFPRGPVHLADGVDRVAPGVHMRTLLRSLRVLTAAFLALCFVVSPALAHDGPAMQPLVVDDVEGLFAEPIPPPEGWRTVQGLYTRIHAHPDDIGTARALTDHADASVPQVSNALGFPPGATIEIFLAPDTETFRSMQPGRPPEWADGTAWPNRGLIFLRSNRVRIGVDEPLTQVLDHELVHIILGRAFSPRPVPSWLQEGAAQILARQYSPELTDRLASGLLGDSLLALDDITRGFPRDAGRARLAYAQSADLVAYLQNTYGEETLSDITLGLARGYSVDRALREATGESSVALDRAWRSRLTASPMWLKPLVADSTLLGVTGLIFIVGGVMVRRRRRVILDRWEREEAMHDAIYASLMGAWPGQPTPLPPLRVVQAGWGATHG